MKRQVPLGAPSAGNARRAVKTTRLTLTAFTMALRAKGSRPSRFMTAIIYFGEIFVASLLAVALLSISPLGVLSASELFVGGVVVWTLIEYLVHRFVLHDLFPTRHGMHHANPDEPVLTVFWQIWACFAVVYFVADGAFLAGALVAYAWYLFVHHSAHHSPNNLLLSLLKHHRTHHRFATRNFGVSTSLWDHVFRTMSR